MNRITLPARTFTLCIKAALLSASGDDTRPHLSGVLVRTRPGAVEVVSTDVHRVGRFRMTGTTQDAPASLFFLPLPVAKEWASHLKGCARKRPDHRTLTLQWDAERCTLAVGPCEYTARLPDVKFPPHEKVFPSAGPYTGGAVGVNPVYLMDAAKAIKVLDLDRPGPRGGAAAVFRHAGPLDPCRIDAYAAPKADGDPVSVEASIVIMPLKTDLVMHGGF